MAWLSIYNEDAARALSGGLRIQVSEIPDSPEDITCAVVDDQDNIHLVRSYFTPPAWTALSALVHSKAEGYVWMCGLCKHDLSAVDLGCKVFLYSVSRIKNGNGRK